MSEYWKSTPKYWCKHCSAYVKDTPFERKQHESTAKHQGNLKRFLRGIQNDHERTEREKGRAKAEVERLNKIVGGHSQEAQSSSKQQNSLPRKMTASSALSAADQKKQWAQLAEMGIQVPEGFRTELAMPGEWQKTAPDQQPTLIDESLNKGVRKRKFEGQEEEEEAGETVVRRGWGSTTRRYPGDNQNDLDLLLETSITKKETNSAKPELEEKTNGPDDHDSGVKLDAETESETTVSIKREPQYEPKLAKDNQQVEHIKQEPSVSHLQLSAAVDDNIADAPVFKKRKAKVK